jgi:hypothetical protein
VKRWKPCLCLVLTCLMYLSAAGRVQADEPATNAKSGDEDAVKRPEPLRVSGAITELAPISETRLIPPFQREIRGQETTTAVWPFFFQRKSALQTERLVVPYYYLRGPKLNADVALALVWWLRGPNRNTFVLPPFWVHHRDKDWGFGLWPLIDTAIFDGHHHTVIPPLLTWIDGDKEHRRAVFGPYYDWITPRKHWRGLFPFWWSKKDDVDRFTVVPPFYFRFADDDPLDYTTIVPPFYHLRTKEHTKWGLAPLFFRSVRNKLDTPEGEHISELKSVTVPLALFHYANGPDDFRLVTPLVSYVDSKKNGRTLITLLYQRKRGDKNLDAVAPLYFHTWDNRDASYGYVIPPIYWHFQDPANKATVVLPFFGRWFHEGISNTWLVPIAGHYKSFERDEQTWWIAPTFHLGWDEKGWAFNIHPLFYLKRSKQEDHLAVAPFYFDFHNRETQTRRFVLAPLYWDFTNTPKAKQARVAFPLWWDFENGRRQTSRKILFPLYWDFSVGLEKKRTIAAFPLYYRLDRGDTRQHIALNTFYETKKDAKGASHWQFHFFPLVSFGGGDQNEKWWNFLYGFAGYERRGTHRRIKAFWLPINLRDKPVAAPSPRTAP